MQKLLANTASSISQNMNPINDIQYNGNKKENVINLSDYNPTNKELEILSLGLRTTN